MKKLTKYTTFSSLKSTKISPTNDQTVMSEFEKLLTKLHFEFEKKKKSNLRNGKNLN